MKSFILRFSDEKTFDLLTALAKKEDKSLNKYIETVLINHVAGDISDINMISLKDNKVISNKDNPIAHVISQQSNQDTEQPIKRRLLLPAEWIAVRHEIEQWDEIAISKFKDDLSNADYLTQKQKDLILKP